MYSKQIAAFLRASYTRCLPGTGAIDIRQVIVRILFQISRYQPVYFKSNIPIYYYILIFLQVLDLKPGSTKFD